MADKAHYVNFREFPHKTPKIKERKNWEHLQVAEIANGGRWVLKTHIIVNNREFCGYLKIVK